MRAHLGLGSNQGDRLEALKRARAALARHGVQVTASSAAYETAPQGEVRDQPCFLNACLTVEWNRSERQLLDVCKAVERELGRDQGGRRHGPRAIDVDVLLVDGRELQSDHLTIPHPGLTTRRFVLEPLLELDPCLRLPDGSPLMPLLESVRDQPVTRLGPF